MPCTSKEGVLSIVELQVEGWKTSMFQEYPNGHGINPVRASGSVSLLFDETMRSGSLAMKLQRHLSVLVGATLKLVKHLHNFFEGW